jgi:RNA polymerase sigma-70 factor, ECF subfamily
MAIDASGCGKAVGFRRGENHAEAPAITKGKEPMSPTTVLERNSGAADRRDAGSTHGTARAADDRNAEDRALLARIAGADKLALRRFFLLHQTRIFRYVQRMVRNEAVSEELTNEVFLDVWLHAKSYEGRSSVMTWLLTLAHNRTISALRKRRDEAWNEDEAKQIPDGVDSQEVAVQKADKGKLLRQCLEALPSDQREIMDLVYYHERSIAEVSAILGMPEGTVKTKMFNARKRLSELLRQAGVDRGWP